MRVSSFLVLADECRQIDPSVNDTLPQTSQQIQTTSKSVGNREKRSLRCDPLWLLQCKVTNLTDG